MKPEFTTLYDLYVTQQLTAAQIGKQFDESQQKISKWISDYGIASRDLRNLVNRGISKPTREELEDLYLVQRLTTRQLAMKLGVVPTSIKNWLREYDIKRRPGNDGMENRGLREPTREELVQLLQIEHRSYREVADMFGVTTIAITKRIEKWGIQPSTVWGTRTKGHQPTPPTQEELTALYESGISLTDIGDQFDLSAIIIRRLCRDYGIKVRPDGWNAGKRFACQDGHLVRSMYERRVDDWLFAHNIPHVYDPQLPPDRRYKADFLANGWYIEIWGVTDNSTYKKRAQYKRQLYHQYGLPLIEIGHALFTKRYQVYLERRLRKILTPIQECLLGVPLVPDVRPKRQGS